MHDSMDITRVHRIREDGQANRSQMGCIVQAVFGIMLINILAITNTLVAIFVA